MKVCYAAQLLSGSVALALGLHTYYKALPEDCAASGKFADFMNKAFDSLNGTSSIKRKDDDLKTAISDKSLHHEFYPYSKKILKVLNFYKLFKESIQINKITILMKKKEKLKFQNMCHRLNIGLKQ